MVSELELVGPSCLARLARQTHGTATATPRIGEGIPDPADFGSWPLGKAERFDDEVSASFFDNYIT